MINGGKMLGGCICKLYSQTATFCDCCTEITTRSLVIHFTVEVIVSEQAPAPGSNKSNIIAPAEEM